MIRSLRSHLGLLAFAALTSGTAFGQLPVSRTAGALNIALPKGQLTLLSLPMTEIVASGSVTAVAGNVLTLSSTPASLPNVLATPHAIKITSRVNQSGTNAYGLSAQITVQSGQDVTAVLGTAPNVGDEFVIYQLETLTTIFGATNSFGLFGASTAASADKVYIESSGTLVGYYYKSSGVTGGIGWRSLTDNATSQANVVIPPGRGLMINRVASGVDRTMSVTGDLIPGNAKPSVVSGVNLLNNPFMLATTLDESGLKDAVTGASTAASADILYLENGGTLTGYWYKNAGVVGGTGWRSIASNSIPEGATPINPGKAILFNDKGTTGITLFEPFAK